MKLLVKIGSALISHDHRIDYNWLRTKVDEIALLYREGVKPIIVSSGAVAAGMEVKSLRKRPSDTINLQMLSGIGQVSLSKSYKDLFKERYIITSQILLTHHNFDNSHEVETITAIINEYIEDGVVPIINENDMINKEEFDSEGNFTDNDILSAFVAVATRVDRAVILTNVDGLYDGDPHSAKNGSREPRLIREVSSIDDSIKKMAVFGKSELGLGGMQSKVHAAEIITKAGIETIIANGNYSIVDILEGKVPCTRFIADSLPNKNSAEK